MESWDGKLVHQVKVLANKSKNSIFMIEGEI